MFGLGPLEIVVVGAIAVMLYGKRLPEVGRTVGKTVGDLRRQWNAMARELEMASQVDSRTVTPTGSRRHVSAPRYDEDDAGLVAGPRFDPPAGDG